MCKNLKGTVGTKKNIAGRGNPTGDLKNYS